MARYRLWAVGLVLALCWSSLSAQSPRLDSIQAAIAEELGLATTTGTARGITRAYVQVCTDYPAYEKIDTLSFDSAAGKTVLPTDCDRVKSVDLILTGGVRRLLKSLVGLPADSLFKRIGEETEGTTNPAEQDYYNVEAGYLTTYPRWMGQDSLLFEVKYYALGSSLDSASDSIQTDPGFYNAVFYYACAEIQQKRGNFTDALNYRKLTWVLYGPPKGGIPQ